MAYHPQAGDYVQQAPLTLMLWDDVVTRATVLPRLIERLLDRAADVVLDEPPTLVQRFWVNIATGPVESRADADMVMVQAVWVRP